MVIRVNRSRNATRTMTDMWRPSRKVPRNWWRSVFCCRRTPTR